MMRSLFSGVSGLRVHQTKMDVISNNIANVNTVGYKSSRVTFNEVFSQMVGGASSANAATNRGGINPMQIGLGANVASIDKLMTTGASQRTDNPFDIMIQGEGFLIVGDGSGTYFTRAGALNLDAQGNLVTSTGLKVMGWNANADGTSITKGVVGPIEITGSKEYIVPAATTQIDYSGNINASTNTATPKVMSMTIYDSVGNSYVVDTQVQYTKGQAEVVGVGNPGDADYVAPQAAVAEGWHYSIIPVAYLNGDRTNGVKITVDPDDCSITFTQDPPITGDPAVEIGLLNFDTNGLVSGFTPANADASTGVSENTLSTGKFVLKVNSGVPPENELTPSSLFGATIVTPEATIENGVVIDLSSMTQFGQETSNATSSPRNGNGPGTLNGLSIGSDGTIMGRYSNGQTKILAQISVAVFKNPAGLEKVGSNLFVTTSNSGDFDGIGQEVNSDGGSILGGVLEMSNVDLSSEFVEMITTQRGFQASSRVISTSDEILQELVNLKR